MQIEVSIIIKEIKIEPKEQGLGKITVQGGVKIGNLHPSHLNNFVSVTMPMTEELDTYIKTIVAENLGKILESKEDESK